MADTRPSPATPWRALRLCLLAIFAPRRLIAEEAADAQRREAMGPRPEPEHGAFIVRRAFWSSLGVVLAAGAVGAVAGCFWRYRVGCTPRPMTVGLQLVGALLLLWGTLFVRGWEIQTWSGVRLPERVNRWIYRSQYFIGTAVIVFSLVASTCEE